MPVYRFELLIESTDTRDNAVARIARVISHDLYFQFQDRLTLFTEDGRQVKYDHLADDGHHEGHDTALEIGPVTVCLAHLQPEPCSTCAAYIAGGL